MTKVLQALDELKQLVEYITRIDYVEPIVRNEVKAKLIDTYDKSNGIFSILEKSLQALEIMKEKVVSVNELFKWSSYKEYNEYSILDKEQELTKDEFDLLKEIF